MEEYTCQKQIAGKHLKKIIQQLPLLFCILKKWKYTQLNISKINSNREKQIILLMKPNREKEGLVVVKQLAALLRRITFVD